MFTIKDVAKKAGVSTATVSRVLHNKGYIKECTRDKVMQAANDLGYITNATAQQLKSTSTKTIGFIISDVNNSYYFNILSKLKGLLSEHEHSLLVSFSSENPIEEEKSFRSLIASRVSVILFTPTTNKNSKIIKIAKKNGIKVIQLFRSVYSNIDTIINDDENGCYLCTKKLLDENCKRIMLIDVDYECMDFSKIQPNRSNGFLRAIENNSNIAYKVIHLPLVNYSQDQLFQAINEFQPDGIIAGTGVFGYLLLALKKAFHQNYSIISFDNSKWFALNDISSIQQDDEQLIQEIYKHILSPDTDTAQMTIIPQKLISRN